MVSCGRNEIDNNTHSKVIVNILEDNPIYDELLMLSSNTLRSRTFTPHYVNSIVFSLDDNTYSVFMTEDDNKQNKHNCFMKLSKNEDGAWMVLESSCYTYDGVGYLEFENKLFSTLKESDFVKLKAMLSQNVLKDNNVDDNITSLLTLFNSKTEYERLNKAVAKDNVYSVELQYHIKSVNIEFLMTVNLIGNKAEDIGDLLIQYIHIEEYNSENINQGLHQNNIPKYSGIIINLNE